MGTRADFYIGRGESAEWLGSIAWDGYPDGVASDVLSALTEAEYRQRLASFFATRDDLTRPEVGWPWPWDTSHVTDYSYAYDERVWISAFGKSWLDHASLVDLERPRDGEDEDDWEERNAAYYNAPKMPPTAFPNMRDRRNVAWDKRSGLIIVSAKDSAS